MCANIAGHGNNIHNVRTWGVLARVSASCAAMRSVSARSLSEYCLEPSST
jgi:hypothetical protein